MDLDDIKEEEPEHDEPLTFIPITHIVSSNLPLETNIEINYGSLILQPHIRSILSYIENRLNKSNAKINKTELIILSRISEFVSDAETCDTLLKLIVPILSKKVSESDSEEKIIHLLNTVINLIQHVEKPEVHLRTSLNLLGTLSSVEGRKLLIKLLDIIAKGTTNENKDKILKSNDILLNLNAWDKRWIDQPDFQKRLDAFAQIENLIQENDLELEFGVAFIYNCFYTF